MYNEPIRLLARMRNTKEFELQESSAHSSTDGGWRNRPLEVPHTEQKAPLLSSSFLQRWIGWICLNNCFTQVAHMTLAQIAWRDRYNTIATWLNIVGTDLIRNRETLPRKNQIGMQYIGSTSTSKRRSTTSTRTPKDSKPVHRYFFLPPDISPSPNLGETNQQRLILRPIINGTFHFTCLWAPSQFTNGTYTHQ